MARNRQLLCQLFGEQRRPPTLERGTVFLSTEKEAPQLDWRNPKSRPWVVVHQELSTLVIIPRSRSNEGHPGIASRPLPGCYSDSGSYLPGKRQSVDASALVWSRLCERRLCADELSQICGDLWVRWFGREPRREGRP